MFLNQLFVVYDFIVRYIKFASKFGIMMKAKQLIIAVLTLVNISAMCAMDNFGDITYGEATNISGMQRMLSQRITKVYLLKLNGATGAAFDKEYKGGLELFNKNFIKLSKNSEGASGEVKAAVKAEGDAWKAYMDVVIFKKAKDVNTILAASNALLKKCHALVLAIEKEGGKDGGDPEKINTVNVSGKQRMLSQRLGEYYSGIRLVKSQGGDTSALGTVLKSVFDEINASYNKLSTSGLNTASITAKFTEIKAKIDYLNTEKAQFFSNSFSINRVTEFCNSLTSLYNDVTGMYAKL